MVKWDEYRKRNEAVVAMFIEARQQLALKKVWVHMVSARHSIVDIFKKFRKKLLFAMLLAKKEFAAAKVRGVWKRCMSLQFA